MVLIAYFLCLQKRKRQQVPSMEDGLEDELSRLRLMTNSSLVPEIYLRKKALVLSYKTPPSANGFSLNEFPSVKKKKKICKTYNLSVCSIIYGDKAASA